MKFIRMIFLAAFLFSSSLSLAQSMLSKVLEEHIEYQIEIPRECLYYLKKHIANGGNLVSQEVLKRSIVIEDFPREDVKDREFSHYTDASTALDKITAKQSYGDIFKYLRDNKRSFYDWQFYVAGDTESSRGYGNAGYRVMLKPKTLVFFSYGDVPGAPLSNWDQVASAITAELVTKNPSLQSCDFVHGTDTHILTYLAAEASGVGAIAYKGTGNRFGGNAYNAQWLQIISPSAIESMERFK